jgi:hypothetical protein
MAACTTAPGIGVTGWPATGRVAPRGAIPRGALGRARVGPATYARRRIAVGVLALGLLVVAARAGDALGGSPLAAPERRPAGSSGEAASIVVHPGDTLWSIATRLAPDEDPRPLVDRLVAARGTAALQPGERIALPG